MSYSERIKNFGSVRDTMREFFVYGFKSRDEYTKKSARSYDNEKRRLESWLGGYMRFRQKPDGKAVFLSIDSRAVQHNPLYTAWKAKSFTDGDITLHFLLMDILPSPDVLLPLSGITERIDALLAGFPEPKVFDESTVRKKLKEYADAGIVETVRSGKTVLYSRTESAPPPGRDFLDFFSEVSPCGVIGSFLLDREADEGKGEDGDRFRFKHHYITGAMDSGILCALFDAIGEKRTAVIETVSRGGRVRESRVVPIKIMMSVQSGRQYLMAYTPAFRRFSSIRLDAVVSVKADEVCARYGELDAAFGRMLPHIWGVSTQNRSGQTLEYVEFTVRYRDDEGFIPARLEREKRCGTVEHLPDNRSRFSAWVYDSGELIPWIRTFLCRITEYRFSNEEWQRRFADDLDDMYGMYGISGEEGGGA